MRALPGLLLVAALLASSRADAEGLRLGLGTQFARYTTPTGENVDLLNSSVSARVSRGRAGLTLAAPYVALSGGRIALSDERLAVTGGGEGWRHGLGDMSVSLDYNLLQNRQAAHIYVVTLSGSLRFPTASTALQIGTGEHLLGFGLSGLYGLTRQLLLFAEARQSWVGILTPVSARARWGELGVVYWVTEKLGATASLVGADYGQRAGTSLELNAGLLFELLPGMMMNLGGLGGLAGQGAPRAGGSFGFGFEL